MIKLYGYNTTFFLNCLELLDARMELSHIIFLDDCSQILENYKDIYSKYRVGIKNAD